MGIFNDAKDVAKHTALAAAAALRGDEAGTDKHMAAAVGSTDDGRRYTLTYPRGRDEFMDNLRPDADTHTIGVYGTADLERRLSEAERLNVQVSYREITDENTAEA